MENNPFLNGVRRSWNTMPPITKTMVVTICVIHLISILLPAILSLGKNWGNVYNVCFDGRISRTTINSAADGLGHYVWTFLISTWSHAGIFHLLMNTLVLVTSGSNVEHTFGSSGAFLIFTLLLQLFSNTGIAAVYSFNLFTPTCVLGLSGVLFGYIAFECNLLHRRAMSISELPPTTMFCGLVPMKVVLMPWFLLLIGIVLMPGTSTLGHFIGLISGMAVAWLPVVFEGIITVGKQVDNLFLDKLIVLCAKTYCGRRWWYCGASSSEEDGDSTAISSSSSFSSNGTVTPGGSTVPRAPYASKFSFGMLGRMRGTGPGDLVAAEEGEANSGGVEGSNVVYASSSSSAAQNKPYVPFSGQGRKLGGTN